MPTCVASIFRRSTPCALQNGSNEVIPRFHRTQGLMLVLRSQANNEQVVESLPLVSNTSLSGLAVRSPVTQLSLLQAITTTPPVCQYFTRVAHHKLTLSKCQRRANPPPPTLRFEHLHRTCAGLMLHYTVGTAWRAATSLSALHNGTLQTFTPVR